MSTLSLAKGALKSRIVRKTITGDDRLRIIDTKHPISNRRDNQGNWLTAIFDAGKFLFNVVGFLLNIGGGLIVTAVTWLHQAYIALKNFNWNASDDQLEKAFDNQLVALAGIWGGTLGQSLGWLAAIGLGYGISFLIPVIGSATLARTIASKTSVQALEELGGSFRGALAQTTRVLAQGATTTLYINIRKWLKSASIQDLEAYFGTKNAIYIKQKWGNDHEPELSLQKWQEDRIQEIDNKYLRAFVNSLVEEAEESFWEGGYIVAHEIDAAYQHAKQANKTSQGKRRSVKITPDKRVKNKLEGQIVLTGTEQQLRADIPEVLAQHRMLVNKDLGVVVGLPAEDFAIAKVLRRQLVLVFKSKETPPWTTTKNGKRDTARQTEVTIPDVALGVSWDKIKRLCRPWQWGAFKCWVKLDNGRLMTVYGSSKKTAETKMKDFLQLTTANVISWHFGEEGDKKNVRLKKKPIMVYPAYGTLLVRKPTAVTSRTVTQTGKAYEDGSILEEQILRFDLWVDQQPDNYTPLN